MEGFVKVARREEITPDGLKLVQVEGKQVVLGELEGQFFAFNNLCPHDN